MELSSQILIFRNGTLYRSDVEELSSIILFKQTANSIDEYLDQLSSQIDQFTANIDTYLYSKSEMKSLYASMDTVLNLTSNTTYVLSSNANSTANTLKTIDDLNKWYSNTSRGAVNIVIGGYNMAVHLVNTDPIESDKIGEYSHAPSYETIMK